jgi:hypothetical protein
VGVVCLFLQIALMAARYELFVMDLILLMKNQKKFSIVKDGKILYIICGLIWVRDWSHAEGVLCVAKYGAL